MSSATVRPAPALIRAKGITSGLGILMAVFFMSQDSCRMIPDASAAPPPLQAWRSGRFHDGLTRIDVARANDAGLAQSRNVCAECGIVVSTDRVELSARPGVPDPTGPAVLREDADPAERDGEAADRDADGTLYLVTIRFDDGLTILYGEDRPRSWRPGTRVRILGRQPASND